VAWLDRAIVSGQVPSGSFLFRGTGDDFPFYAKQGKFQVLLGARDVILDFQEGWPRLEEILAELHFDNERLDIRVNEASLLESRVRDTHAWLPDLDDARHVFLKGRVSGPFKDGFRILRETPLAQHKARYVAGMQGKGRNEVRLDLAIPVDSEEDYRIDGRIVWNKNASLLLQDLDLSLDALNGALTFNDRGVFAEAIEAELWEQPLRASVHTSENGGGNAGATRIEVDLPLRPATLARHYPHDGWQSFDGAAPARLTLDIEHGRDNGTLPIRYRLQSDLKGLGVKLPAPLSKPRQSKRRLSLGGNLPVRNGDLLTLGYGDIQGSFRLQRDADSGVLDVDAAVVHCGTGETPKVERTGFVIGGQLEELDAAAWTDWLSRNAPASPSDPDERRNPSQRLDLAIDRLTLPKGRLSDVLLDMTRTPNAWDIKVRSRELAGTMRLPDGGRDKVLSINLKVLRLDPEQWDGTADADANWPAPREAQGIYLNVKELYLGGRPFGSLKARAKPVPEGLRLEQLMLEGPLLTLQGEGDWLDEGNEKRSRLSLKGGSADLGRALRELNLTTALGQSPLQFDADLGWRGPLLEPAFERIEGNLNFHIGEGRIHDVEPGVGRLFGLLNLGALGRRLTLDFTDLFNKGYAFDHIDARFSIGDGNAIAERVEIAGPAADLAIQGRTGLLARDYEQIVTVTPELSATLPLAGALAGGPVAAAALLLAEQVMGEEVNKLIRYQYEVTGPWEQPVITPIQTQDGWSLSNLLRPAARKNETTAETQRDEEPLVH